MPNTKLVEVAQDTIKITKQGFYEINNKKINLLSDIYHKFESVKVYDTEKLESIRCDCDDFFENSFNAPKQCSFYLVDSDSFEAAEGLERPLVMNFANARYPGGGFLNGAQAQEESLCRCSTLYESLSSKEAQEMYCYNNQNTSPLGSDYMLLSPNVCVFRDHLNNLLVEPYLVSVFTIPAPNKNGRAKYVEQMEIDVVMKERLRKFLMTAARNNYSTLVLGAWGCGAFGHDARTVAKYFYDLFFEEKFCQFFETVVFAILNSKDKINDFAEVFGDEIENCTKSNDNKYNAKRYYKSEFDYPVCNHVLEVDSSNIGYTLGITHDGVPFEAELWKDSEEILLQVILPKIFDRAIDKNGRDVVLQHKNDSIACFNSEAVKQSNSVLAVGMIDDGYEENIDQIEEYLVFLEEKGIISFVSDMRNGGIYYLIDSNGKNLVGVIVSLRINNMEQASTTLEFRKFFMDKLKGKFTIIK